jgi:glycosyltransferase involved in cell wall biosynthesis
MTSMMNNRAMGSRSSVTVVICTHNRPGSLERCLRALQKVGYANFSVTVVDSAPSSDDAKILASLYNVDYCVSSVRGLSRARNIGTRASRSEIVAYLDDDMVPHARWLQALVDGFTDQDVKAVTGPVLPLEAGDSNEVELGVMLERVPWGPVRFDLDRLSRQWFERANFGGIGDGNFALRRDAFDKLPNFDERLGRGVTINSSEEHYAYFKLVSMGSRIAYVPRGIVFHPRPQMTNEYRRRIIAEAIAYAAFLISQHPSRCWRVAKYFAIGAIGSGRWWRNPSNQATSPLSFREKSSALLEGLSAYWQTWRQSHQVSRVDDVDGSIQKLTVKNRHEAKPTIEAQPIIHDPRLSDYKEIGDQAKGDSGSGLLSASGRIRY